jgi:hypothetical protein
MNVFNAVGWFIRMARLSSAFALVRSIGSNGDIPVIRQVLRI